MDTVVRNDLSLRSDLNNVKKLLVQIKEVGEHFRRKKEQVRRLGVDTCLF